jgi:hypothetical protein
VSAEIDEFRFPEGSLVRQEEEARLAADEREKDQQAIADAQAQEAQRRQDAEDEAAYERVLARRNAANQPPATPAAPEGWKGA